MLGDRRACLARELTKRHEEVLRDRASALSARLSDAPPRGECTLVIAGAEPEEAERAATWSEVEVDAAIRASLVAGDSVKDLASALASRAGWPRRDVYARALEVRDAMGEDG